MPDIDFRPLAADDLAALFLWLGQPHVSKWYAPAPTSFAEVVAKYGPRTEPGSAVRAFLIVFNGVDAGYIQTYAIDLFPDYAAQLGCEPGVAGMDLFLGDTQLLHRGLGPQIVRRFVEAIVFGQDQAPACVAGPTEGNAASIRAFEKAGFRRWKVIKMKDVEAECVLRLDRTESERPDRADPLRT
ncbi:MAG TPA: GNAT family N-acetyltransferase [Usitatibacter sp.]|nr:GNAT family N-acetyltransferase [Usitatibacter sp.]